MRQGVWDLYRDGLTQGSIGLWLTCRQKFEHGMLSGWSGGRGSSMPMDFGSYGHNALEYVYSAFGEERDAKFNPRKVLEKAFAKEIDEAEKRIRQTQIIGIEESVKKVEDLCKFVDVVLGPYFDHWGSYDWTKINWAALENVFMIPLITKRGNSVPIKGKWDGVFETDKKSLYLFETKFKGKFTDLEIMSTISMNLQVLLYLWSVWKTFNRAPAGVVYNVVRRPLLRQGVHEDTGTYHARCYNDILARPAHYYCRYPASFHLEELQAFEAQLHYIVDEIEEWYLGQSGTIKHYPACTSSWGPCPFIELCANENSNELERKQVVYPELVLHKL